MSKGKSLWWRGNIRDVGSGGHTGALVGDAIILSTHLAFHLRTPFAPNLRSVTREVRAERLPARGEWPAKLCACDNLGDESALARWFGDRSLRRSCGICCRLSARANFWTNGLSHEFSAQAGDYV